MLRLILAICLIAVLAPAAAPVFAQSGQERIVVAQEKKRTLFDWLFGKPEDQKPAAGSTQNQSNNGAASPSITRLEDIKPPVEKSGQATRLIVFGDSLAVDLAKSLARAHADDPNLVVLGEGVGSSGFVRDDFYDWNGELSAYIDQNAFDIAVMIIGINDRQPIGQFKPLTDEWKAAYSERLATFMGKLRAAGKPVIWVGLPPMQAPTYSGAMSQISSIQKLAAFSGGAEFVDIYERFVDEAGAYSNYGPDLNGQKALMRKSDGIHFSSAGSDKVAFYVTQALKRFYRGGGVSVEVADVLAGTDAANMIRMPFQGLGQSRLIEIAGAVTSLSSEPRKADQLVLATPVTDGSSAFDLDLLINAPVGRADAFGVGIEPGADPSTSRAKQLEPFSF